MRKSLVILGAILTLRAEAQELGKIGSIERQVLLGSRESLRQVKLGQGFAKDQQLRTLRRSKAILDFSDRSQLRVNERTDLIIRPTPDLMRYQLGAGAIWLKVPKGLKVEIETPVLTAAVRGTEFEINAEGEVRVYEGSVEVKHGSSLTLVETGKMHTSDGVLRQIPCDQLPLAYGGPSTRWWETIVPGRDAPALLNPDPVVTSRLIDYWNRKDQGTVGTGSGPQFDFDSPQRDFYSALGALGAFVTGSTATSTQFETELGVYGGDATLTIAQTRAKLGIGKSSASFLLEARADSRGSAGWESRLPSESMFKFSGGVFAGRGVISETASRIGAFSHGLLNDRLSGAGVISDSGGSRLIAMQMASRTGNSEVIGLSRYIGGSKIGLNLSNTRGDLAKELNLQLASYSSGFETYMSWLQIPGRNIGTFGFNLSSLFDKTGWDVCLESQVSGDSNPSYSLRIGGPAESGMNWYALAQSVGNSRQVGVGASIRF